MDLISNPKQTLTHEELSVIALDEVVPGLLAAFDLTQVANETILGVGVAMNVNLKFVNLFLASPHLYRTLNEQYQYLEALKIQIEDIANFVKRESGEESATLAKLILALDGIQKSAIDACRCVTEGIAKVAEEIRKGA